MLKNYIGILSAIENKENLRRLAAHRAVASIPLAGKYRVVDFMLSNMSNAGITTVGIFTDNDSRSFERPCVEQVVRGNLTDITAEYLCSALTEA